MALIDKWQELTGGNPRSNGGDIAGTVNASLNADRALGSVYDDKWTDLVPYPSSVGENSELNFLGHVARGIIIDKLPGTNNGGSAIDKVYALADKLVPPTIGSAARGAYRAPYPDQTYQTNIVDMKKDS